MPDNQKAKEYRDTVAESFVRSDPQFSDQLMAAPTAVAFQELLKAKFWSCDREKDLSLRVRLLRHASRNKPFVAEEQEEN